MKDRLSLRTRLSRVIIITGISFYLITSLIVAAIEIRKKRSDYASAMITTVKTCEAIIRDYINQYHKHIQHIITKMPDAAEPVLINYFRENLHFQSLRDRYYILDHHHHIMYIQRPYEQYQGLDLSHIQYVSEKLPVSKVHQSLFSQQPVVSFLYPLHGGRLLVLEKDLKGIIPLAEHFNLGEIVKGSYMFILSANGTVVYHPDRKIIDSRHNLGFELTDWSDPDARGLQTFTYHDKKYLCYKRTLEKPIGWTLYFAVPHAVLFWDIAYHVAQLFLIFAIVFSFLIFFLQLITYRKLSKPVSEIVAGISTCKLDGTDKPIAQDKASGTRELASIIDAINNMITELNRSNEDLRKSEQRHRTLVETITDVVFTLDTHGKFTFLNPEFEKLVGYAARDFIGHAFSEILAPEYIESTDESFRRGLAGETIPIYEVEVIHKDGKRIPIELNMTSLLDAQKRPVGRIGVARDITDRRHAEKVMEEAYEIISRSPAVALLWKNKKGWPVEFISDNAERVFGYTAGEFISGKIVYSEIVHPDDLERVTNEVKTYSKEMKTKRFTHEPYRIVTKDGSVKWVDDKIYIRRDKRDRITHYQGIVEDITARRSAEEALRASEIEKKAILDASIDRIRLVDTDMRILWANKTTTRELHIAPEDLVGQLCYKAFVGTKSPCAECPTKKALKSGKVEHAVVHLDHSKDMEGETYWDMYSVPLKNESGDIVTCIQVGRNITARMKMEDALRHSEARFRDISFSMADWMWEVDSKERYTFASGKVREILGYDPEELIGKTPFELMPVDEAERIGDTFKRITSEGKPIVDLENWCLTKKGERICLLSNGVPMVDESGTVIGYRGVDKDITANKLAEEEKKTLQSQLLRAQKMEAIGTLAGGVAHDLNNVLSGLVSYPELLLMDLPPKSPLRKPIETIQRSGEKAAAIVQDLLTLARRGVMATEVTNLNWIVMSYLRSPEHEKLKEFHPDVIIEHDLELDLLNIMGSPVHLAKTVMNLLTNAAEAMPQGGTITISTATRYIETPIRGYDEIREGDYVLLIVSDTGVGILPEDKERIFEPFYTKKVMGRSGTGLGMAVVWGTVKDHKGYIDIQSAEGKGTTFTLYFPVTRKEIPGHEEIRPMEDYMGKGESILIIDDVEEQRDIAARILKKLGYTVTSVASGEEAVDYMKDNAADLLVLDMIMDPGIDGLDTYQKILALHPQQKAIITSGFSETERVKKAQRLGAGTYIKKPYTLEKIGCAVKEELEK